MGHHKNIHHFRSKLKTNEILRSFQAYPMDERHWLMGTVYNTGIECLQFVRFTHPCLAVAGSR